MTPTKEQVDAAREWLSQYDAVGMVWEWRTATSELLAAYAAHCVAEKDAEIARLRERTAESVQNNATEAFLRRRAG